MYTNESRLQPSQINNNKQSPSALAIVTKYSLSSTMNPTKTIQLWSFLVAQQIKYHYSFHRVP